MPAMDAAADLEALQAQLLSAIDGAANLAALEDVRIAALGKKGSVSELMQRIGSLPPQERKAFGAAVNAIKSAVSDRLEARKAMLDATAVEARLASERADVTLPVRP